jgi:hypothetical protein
MDLMRTGNVRTSSVPSPPWWAAVPCALARCSAGKQNCVRRARWKPASAYSVTSSWSRSRTGASRPRRLPPECSAPWPEWRRRRPPTSPRPWALFLRTPRVRRAIGPARRQGRGHQRAGPAQRADGDAAPRRGGGGARSCTGSDRHPPGSAAASRYRGTRRRPRGRHRQCRRRRGDRLERQLRAAPSRQLLAAVPRADARRNTVPRRLGLQLRVPLLNSGARYKG